MHFRAVSDDHEVAYRLIRALNLARDLNYNLFRARALSVSRNVPRTDAVNLASQLDTALAIARDIDLVRDLGRVRDRARYLGRVLVEYPVSRTFFAAGICEPREARRIGLWATGLLTAAACLLPAADRARYAEEYQSELWDIAQDGCGPVRQIKYALRQLICAVEMSCALRFPRRRGARP